MMNEEFASKSAGGEMNLGREVVVVGQDSLKLVVRESNTDTGFAKTE